MRKVVLALCTTLALSSTAAAQTGSAWADKLFAGQTTHDFGVIPRGTQVKHSFKMTNIYKVPLDITDLRVSCTLCLKAELSTKVLQPGESGLLHLTMDSRHFSGPKTIRAYVTVGPKYVSTAMVTVSAIARGEVVFTPHDVDFGTVAHGTRPSKQVDVEYGGKLADWKVTEIVKGASAPFDLEVKELPRQPNAGPRKGYRLVATVKADAPAGSFKQELVLKTNDPANPVLSCSIVGNVQAGLAVSPSPILVSGLRVGEAQSKKVFVRASRPFRVIGVDGQGDGVTVDVPNRLETTQVLTINIQPTKAGDIHRRLMIRTNLDSVVTAIMVEAVIDP